ncbi:MAG TPA: nuclear transport factor 2 family protein [Gemmatimonadaceae bacterium]
MQRTIALSAALFTLGAFGCGTGSPPEAKTEPALLTRSEALAIVDELNEALVSQDAPRIKSHYADDAVVMGLGATAPFANRAEIDQDLDRFAAAGFDTYDLGSRRIQIIDGRHFVLTGASTLRNSGTGDSFPVRYSEVVAKQDDGTWKIISEHISAMPGS